MEEERISAARELYPPLVYYRLACINICSRKCLDSERFRYQGKRLSETNRLIHGFFGARDENAQEATDGPEEQGVDRHGDQG